MVAVDADRNPNVTLSDMLARRARGASDTRLVVDAIVGFVVAVASLLAQGPAWYLFSGAGICFLSFGAWGIADRELSGREPTSRSARWLAGARVVAAVVGYLAAASFFVRAMGIAIGRVIS